MGKGVQRTHNENDMKAKDKARELVQYMLGDNNHYLNLNIETDKLHAKKCALICVDEMIKELTEEISPSVHGFRHQYWKEVKQEIENL